MKQVHPANNRPLKREFIDFSKLTPNQLDKQSEEWEQAARALEVKLDSYMNNGTPNEEKLEKLHKVANSLWRRLQIIENWRRTHPTKRSGSAPLNT